jgi:acyl-CoA synthetase (AMP-forming)/AMP-acid ligase II
MTASSDSSAPVVNIAAALPRMAKQQPHTPAIFYPEGRSASGRVLYSHYTYAQLDQQSDLIAAGLEAVGIGRGVRTVLMVKPSLEFFALTFGIFKAGAVPVMVDPGIGIRNLGVCLAEAKPEAFIGIPRAHIARAVLGWARGTIRTLVTVGRRGPWGGLSLEDVKQAGAARPDWRMAPTTADDMAAILFTSGSTGVPKGVIYSHGNFVAQVDAIRAMYDIRPGEIDLPTFPLFALFDPALGMTTVVPDMDFTRPAAVSGAKIAEAIEDFGITNMFGSPALLNTVGRWGEANKARFPSLRRVISAGAPVPAAVMERFAALLEPEARINTPYGATESLPVATIDHVTVLTRTRPQTETGAGVCVGFPVPTINVQIIGITDDPIERWSDDLVVPTGTVGEMVVQGDVVTHAYFGRDTSTKLAKIRNEDGTIRHRMGDVGYFDADGRLWFCGRKSHRVTLPNGTVMHSVPCEAVFDTHPAVFRSALVAAPAAQGGGTRPVLCVELEPDARGTDRDTLVRELRAIAQKFEHTRPIEDFLIHPAFPVDIRHNAKIGREKLSVWATAQLAAGRPSRTLPAPGGA